jgi:replicative DNA helicase
MTVELKPKPKVPPNSKEAEMMVLGCMLTSINALNISSEKLSKEDFYYNEHKLIFNVLKSAYNNDKLADVHVVCEELKRLGKLESSGGAAYLTTLAQFAGTSAHIEEYCNIVRTKSYSRKMLNVHLEAENDFLNDPENPEKLAEKHHQKIIEIGKRYSPNDKASIGEILSGSKSRIDPIPTIERLKVRQDYYKEHGESCLTGLPTGFIDIDKKVTLLEDTNLIVIAGRPAMGKTAYALNILSNICFQQGAPVGFISLEMGADQLVERMLSARSGVSGEKIKRGTFTDIEFKKIQQEDECLKKAKFFIHDQAVSTVSQVVSRARRLKDEEDIRILAVDYLQLLGTDSGNDSRQYEVAEVSRTLKRLAMELKIPIIVVAQLSRKVEERQNKKPLMSDLRDSGQIEQDADSILFVYRREYYDPNDKKGQAEIILSKNRHGPTLDFSLSFNSECGVFGNLSPISQAPRGHDYN